MDAATIAVILSVLVLAFQARSLAEHARIANEVAGAETNREVLSMWASAQRVFIEYPELRAHYLDESPTPPSALERVRLLAVSEMCADVLQVAVESADRLAPFRRYAEPWRDYATQAIESSSTLRSVIRDLPTAWPGMMPFVAAYDASQRATSLAADHADAPGRS